MRTSCLLQWALVACVVVAAGSSATAQIGSRLFRKRGTGNDPSQPHEAPPPGWRKPTPVPGTTGGPPAGAPPAPSDKMVLPTNSTLPEPLKPEEMAGPAVGLPSGPVDGYLLTK